MESRRQFRGHVFQRVRRHVDVAVFELLFKFLSRKRRCQAVQQAAARFRSPRVLTTTVSNVIPVLAFSRAGNRQRGLGQREPAAASTYAYWPC